MVPGPLPSPEACPPGSAPDGLSSANIGSNASGPQNPRARESIAPGEGWCVLRQGAPDTHTHTPLPAAWPVLEPATSSRQPSHRCTRLSRVRPEVGLFRALGGQWLAALLPVAQLLTFTFLVLPSSEAQARSVSQLAAPQPTIAPLSSAFQWPSADRGGPIHTLLPTEYGAESLLLLSPNPALLGPQVTAPGSLRLLVLPGRWTLGARRYPGAGCSQRTRVLLPSGGAQGKDSQ